jgi:predicted DNA binding CopG/RHH family protein
MNSKSLKDQSKKITAEDDKIQTLLEKIDLSENIQQGTIIQGRRGRPSVGTKISITLPDDLITELKNASEKRAIGYQTLIRMIVKENINKYA